MFSGIIETVSSIIGQSEGPGTLTISVRKPSEFNDLSVGDSIAVDGVCLTLEAFDDERMVFTCGPETLRITGWTPQNVLHRAVNLERSLRFNGRIHGHIVTGHADARSRVLAVERQGETITLTIEIPEKLAPFIWAKGSVALNGVSLTVNRCEAREFTVGLIPETTKRTNLGELKAGDPVNLEVDNMARAFVRQRELEA